MRAPIAAITFTRLTAISPREIAAHMSDARIAAHLPLLKSAWDEKTAQDFVAAKEATWARDGLGHWAILNRGAYIGWGGFQKEGDEWDLGLVLKPKAFGLGPAVARAALAIAREDPRIPYVTFLLAPSRRNLGALGRAGAHFVGEIDYAGERFRKYRLETV